MCLEELLDITDSMISIPHQFIEVAGYMLTAADENVALELVANA
jgi:hypothetical protein